MHISNKVLREALEEARRALFMAVYAMNAADWVTHGTDSTKQVNDLVNMRLVGPNACIKDVLDASKPQAILLWLLDLVIDLRESLPAVEYCKALTEIKVEIEACYIEKAGGKVYPWMAEKANTLMATALREPRLSKPTLIVASVRPGRNPVCSARPGHLELSASA